MAPDAATDVGPTPPASTIAEARLPRRVRLSVWVVAITARSAVDAVQTRHATHL